MNKVLNTRAVNMPRLHGVLNVPGYAWIVPGYAWLCLNMPEYACISRFLNVPEFLNCQKEITNQHKINR